ncbi:sporulation initiation factor Spo0A C-terminal domain-containing protein [Hominifimenecus sp. rT4P-3]|uniref:sporulation initiation factor Spo0A C-terminal domain-containing protein n=1 Tax=Hominifimenecus sp. rT4P-3 TaxID=3242979 RepID=UPI003DA5842E
MTSKSIESVILSIAGHPTSTGYLYLGCAVQAVIDQGQFLPRSLMKTIYQPIAARFGTSTGNVARNIARAVDDCWDYGDRTKLNAIAKRNLTEKPTPGELILFLTHYCSNLKE